MNEPANTTENQPSEVPVDAQEVIPISADAPVPSPKGRKAKLSPALLASAKRRLDADLAIVPADGVIRINREIAIKAAKTLGLSGKEWGVRGLRAKEELGEWLNQPIVIRKLVAVSTMNTLDQIESVIAAGAKIANGIPINEDDKSIIRPEDRAKAIQAVALAAEAHVEMSSHLLKIAESANGKMANGDGSDKPQNKPPDFGAQFTAPDGSTVSVVAKNGA